jgi:hypothetical protein
MLPRFGPEHFADPSAFARTFARRMRQLGSGRVVVLDDWSELEPDGPLDRVLREMLTELAGATGVVVTSRSGPPPALARLRASSGLEVVDGAALAMTATEARAVARLWKATSLSPAMLVQRTGGWAAGIALIAASGARGADASASPGAFEYLACEVFDRMPRRTQEVLLRVSLLHRVSAAAAVKLTGDARAPGVLEDLARAGWFVQRHPGPEPSYQLHPLMREFLAARLPSTIGEDGVRALALESARALEDGGYTAEAVALFRDARAGGEIARLVLTNAPRLLHAGAARSIMDWVELVPPAFVDGNPWLLHWRGAARLYTSPAEGLADAERAFDAFVRAGDAAGAYVAWTGAVHLVVYGVQGDQRALDAWIDALEALRRRFEAWPAPEIEAAVVSGAVLAYSFRRPHDPRFAPWLERALRIALSPGEVSARLNVGCHVVTYAGAMGANLRRARVVFDALRPFVDGRGRALEAITWMAAEGYERLYAGDAERALAVARRALDLGRENGVDHWRGPLLSTAMLAELALDRIGEARTTCDVLAATVPRRGLSEVGYLNSACTLALRTGAPGAALDHGAAAVALADQMGSPHPSAIARVLHALAQERTGSPALAKAARFAREVGQPHCEYGALFAMAAVALERGDEDRAADSAAAAFAIAERTGGRAVVWLSRAEMAEVCALALERGIAPAVALDTIRSCRLPPAPRARRLAAWPWTVRVDALGAFGVHYDGRDPPNGKAQKKPLELLRLLVAHGERGAPLERLAEALWPDADGDNGHRALETTMYRLRRLLGDPAAVVRRGGRASLDAQRVFVDAWAFAELAGRADALATRGAAEALQASAAAIELYRGDLLPDDDLPGIAAERARLRARLERLAALRQR